MGWEKISDEKVHHLWRCTDDECECEHDAAIINPDWYEQNGTPMCECGQDMEYIETEVFIP